MKTEFSPGDLIEKRIDNKYYYSTLNVNPEYGIVLETKVKDRGGISALRTEMVCVLWVGNEPHTGWSIVNPKLIKVGGIGSND